MTTTHQTDLPSASHSSIAAPPWPDFGVELTTGSFQQRHTATEPKLRLGTTQAATSHSLGQPRPCRAFSASYHRITKRPVPGMPRLGRCTTRGSCQAILRPSSKPIAYLAVRSPHEGWMGGEDEACSTSGIRVERLFGDRESV
jgi:hypothetical protein